MCHSEIESSTGIDLARDFTDVVIDHGAENSLLGVASDGTNHNTGWKSGFISHVERFLRSVLLWLVCMVSYFTISITRRYAIIERSENILPELDLCSQD